MRTMQFPPGIAPLETILPLASRLLPSEYFVFALSIVILSKEVAESDKPNIWVTVLGINIDFKVFLYLNA